MHKPTGQKRPRVNHASHKLDIDKDTQSIHWGNDPYHSLKMIQIPENKTTKESMVVRAPVSGI